MESLFSLVPGFPNLLKLTRRASGVEILDALQKDGVTPLSIKDQPAVNTMGRVVDRLAGVFLFLGDLNTMVTEDVAKTPKPRLSWREIRPIKSDNKPGHDYAFLDYKWGPDEGSGNDTGYFVLVLGTN